MSDAKSLFLDLKIGEQVTDAARIDEGLLADMKQVKASLATVTKDRHALRKANQEFKDAEVKVQEERRIKGMVRRSLEEEVDGLGKLVKVLEMQIKGLLDAAASSKEATKQWEAAIFEAGVAAG